jgi:hypothetical protein
LKLLYPKKRLMPAMLFGMSLGRHGCFMVGREKGIVKDE